MTKFKVGDVVQISATSRYANKQNPKTSDNPMGVLGTINSISDGIYLPISVLWENKINNRYNKEDLIIIKNKIMATKKKAAEKKEFELTQGMYFTATYKKKKIRGIVEYINSYVCGLGNKTAGNDNGGDDFNYIIEVDIFNCDNHMDALKDAGVTNFKECTDKRQKAIIDTDKLPKFDGEVVRNIDGVLEFGCGSIKLTKDEIRRWLRVRDKVGIFDYDDDANVELTSFSCYEDVDSDDIKELEKFVNFHKNLKACTKADREAYLEVVAQVKEERDVETMRKWKTEDIEALLAKF